MSHLLNGTMQAMGVGAPSVRIPIKSMHCSSCQTRVERMLRMTPGVLSAHANLGSDAVDVEYDPSRTDVDDASGTRIKPP